jgi:hypothetical protein
MFGKECFARMVMKYGKIRRNVIRALLSRKVGTQGPRFGIIRCVGGNVGACMGGRKRKEFMDCIRKDEDFAPGPKGKDYGGAGTLEWNWKGRVAWRNER